MSPIPLRPLGVGEVLDGAVQLYRRDFGLFYLIALVGALPAYAILLALGEPAAGIDASGSPDIGAVWGSLVALFPAMAASWVGTLALAVAVCARIEGTPTSLEKAYRGVLRPFPSAAGAHLLALLLVGVTAVFVMLGTMVPAAALLAGLGANALAVSAIVLLAVVAILVVLALWFSTTFGIFPAVLLEGASPTGAIRRSFQLCRGAWLRVLAIMLVVSIIRFVPSVAIFAAFGGLDTFTSPEMLGTAGPGRQTLELTLDLLAGALTEPFMIATLFVLYHDRRVRTEAADLEIVAAELGADAR